jgi:hypothetical protein
MRLTIACLRRKDPSVSSRQLRQNLRQFARYGNHSLLIVLRRKALLPFAAHPDAGIVEVPKLHVCPGEVAEFLFPQTGEEKL